MSFAQWQGKKVVKCAKHPWAEKTVYLVEIDGKLIPNGCEDMDGSDVCKKCCAESLKPKD